MTERKKQSDPNPIPPLQSGHMYTGICTTRAGLVSLRYQYILAFVSVNLAIVGLCVQYADFSDEKILTSLMSIILISMSGILFSFWAHKEIAHLEERIEGCTDKLRQLEVSGGTESGIRVFADKSFGEPRSDPVTFVGNSLALSIMWFWVLSLLAGSFTCLMVLLDIY